MKRDACYTCAENHVGRRIEVLDAAIAYNLGNTDFRVPEVFTQNVSLYKRHFSEDVTVVDLNGGVEAMGTVRVARPQPVALLSKHIAPPLVVSDTKSYGLDVVRVHWCITILLQSVFAT